MRTKDEQLIFERYQQINEISNVAGTGQSYSMWNRLKSEFGQSKLGQHLGLFKGAQGQVDTERKANELTRRLQEFAGQTGQDVKYLMRDKQSMANWLNQQVPQVVGDDRLAKTFDGSKYTASMQPQQSPHDFFTYVINQTVQELSQLSPQASTPQVDTNVDGILQNLNALSVDPSVDPQKRSVVNNAIASIQKTFKGSGPRSPRTSRGRATAPSTTTASTATSSTAATSAPASTQTSASQPTAIPVTNTTSAATTPQTTASATTQAPTKGASTAQKQVTSKQSAPVKQMSPKKAASVAKAAAQQAAPNAADQSITASAQEITEPSETIKSTATSDGAQKQPSKKSSAPLIASKMLQGSDLEETIQALKPCLTGLDSEDKTMELRKLLKSLGAIDGKPEPFSAKDVGDNHIKKGKFKEYAKSIAGKIGTSEEKLLNHFKTIGLVESTLRDKEQLRLINCKTI